MKKKLKGTRVARSAYFACTDCKVRVWIGKAVPSDIVLYFNAFGKDLRNWQAPELNRVIWKMFADHAGHHLRVLLEWTPEYEAFIEEDNVLIGGDEPGQDISFEDYLKNWDG